MKRQLSSQEIDNVILSLQTYINEAKQRWDEQNASNKSWIKISQGYILSATKFLVNCLDELINFVETLIPAGKDKKAAVLAVIAKLFDHIAVQTFPLWLKPFSNTIKNIVVYIVVNEMIDYIVAKYNQGLWNTQGANYGQKNYKR